MIPSSFDYVRPATVEDAVAALVDAGDDAKVLAGGQSLMPLLRLFAFRPVLPIVVGHAHALTFLRFIAAISSCSGFCAPCGCSGPA